MITRKRMFLYNFRHVNEKQEDKEIKKNYNNQRSL